MILNPAQKVDAIPSPLEGQVEATDFAIASLSGGVFEVQSVVCPATAGATQADYFVIEDTAGTQFAVWLDIDDAGVAPAGAAYVASDFQIEVNIATGDTAAQVAGKVKTAMEADVNFQDITISINSATLSFTQNLPGNVAAPTRHDAADLGNGSFVVATVTGGVLPDLNSKYFLISSSSVDYYVWFNVNASGVDPSVASRTDVEVVLNGTESASAIAVAVAAAIDALAGLNAEADGSKVMVRADASGDILNAEAGDSAYSFQIQAQGGSPFIYPAMSPSLISNNPGVIAALT